MMGFIYRLGGEKFVGTPSAKDDFQIDPLIFVSLDNFFKKHFKHFHIKLIWKLY